MKAVSTQPNAQLGKDLIGALEATQDDWEPRAVPTPSNAGKDCERALWYLGKGVPRSARIPAGSLLAMRQGTVQERIIYELYAGLGYKIEYQVNVPRESIACAEDGTADGILEDETGARMLLEIKRLGWFGFIKLVQDGLFAANREYYTQVQLYMKGLGLERCAFTAMAADFAAVRSTWRQRSYPADTMPDPIFVELVTYDEYFTNLVIERNQRVMAYIRFVDEAAEVPRIADPVIVGDGWPCGWCGHRPDCLAAGAKDGI